MSRKPCGFDGRDPSTPEPNSQNEDYLQAQFHQCQSPAHIRSTIRCGVRLICAGAAGTAISSQLELPVNTPGPKTGPPPYPFPGELLSRRQGFETLKRMNRADADGTGVLSRTTSCVTVFVSVTVFGGPESQPPWRLPETSTM